MQILVTADISNLKRLAEASARMKKGEVLRIMSWAINDVGDKLRTQVKRQTAKQVGLPYSKTEADWKILRANPGRLEYSITGSGKYHKVDEFSPKQFKYGVRAKPWGRMQKFKNAFLRKGMVLVRLSKERRPLKRLIAGSVPREMERDAVPYIASEGMDKEFPAAIDKKLGSFLPW